MLVEHCNGFEIASDGATVWVNDTCCVGRFCRLGIDLDLSLQLQFGAIAYPDDGTTLTEWRLFQTLMHEHYTVIVTDRHMPSFLRPECTNAEDRSGSNVSAWPTDQCVG